MKKSNLLVAVALVSTVACTKEIEDQPNPPITKNEMNSEAPYEVYLPQGEAYLELEQGITEYFGRQSLATHCDITKGIWLWESGINYWFPSVELINEDQYLMDVENEIIDEREIHLDLDNGQLDNSMLRAEFVRTYEDVDARVQAGLDHAVTDVQYLSKTATMISLKVKSVFYQNATYGSFSSTPTVPSATIDKMLGQAATCSGGLSTGSYTDAARRVKRVFPRPRVVNRSKTLSNVFEFSTYSGSINRRKIDGSYLPGNSNAIFPAHLPGVLGTECLSINQQNAYSQAMANQIDGILLKRIYWDGIARYTVHPNQTVPAGSASWGFYLDLATHFTHPTSLVKISPQSVL